MCVGGGGHLNRSVWWFCRSPIADEMDVKVQISINRLLNVKETKLMIFRVSRGLDTSS